MNTPDWSDAPEWAQWVAMDKDGRWWWYENKPETEFSVWVESSGKFEICELRQWDSTCLPRPTQETEQ